MKIVIVERDSFSPFTSNGAMIWEQKTNVSDEDALERARELANAGKYGKVWVVEADLDYAELVEPEKPVPEIIEVNNFKSLVDFVSANTKLDDSLIADCLANGKPIPFQIIPEVPF